MSGATFQMESQVREQIYKNLKLLEFKFPEPHVKPEEIFKIPQPKLFQQVTYFLFEKLEKPRANETFKSCWPICTKKDELAFRLACAKWLKEIHQKCSLFPSVVPSVLIYGGGPQFCELYLAFSCYVIHEVLVRENGDYPLRHIPIIDKKEKWDLLPAISAVLETSQYMAATSFHKTLALSMKEEIEWKKKMREQVAAVQSLVESIEEKENVLIKLKAEVCRMYGIPEKVESEDCKEVISDMQKQMTKEVRELWHKLQVLQQNIEHNVSIVKVAVERNESTALILNANEWNGGIPAALIQSSKTELCKANLTQVKFKEKTDLIGLLKLWNIAMKSCIKEFNKMEANPEDLDTCIKTSKTQSVAHKALLSKIKTFKEVFFSQLGTTKLQDSQSFSDLMQDQNSIVHILPATPTLIFTPDSKVEGQICIDDKILDAEPSAVSTPTDSGGFRAACIESPYLDELKNQHLPSQKKNAAIGKICLKKNLAATPRAVSGAIPKSVSTTYKQFQSKLSRPIQRPPSSISALQNQLQPEIPRKFCDSPDDPSPIKLENVTCPITSHSSISLDISYESQPSAKLPSNQIGLSFHGNYSSPLSLVPAISRENIKNTFEDSFSRPQHEDMEIFEDINNKLIESFKENISHHSASFLGSRDTTLSSSNGSSLNPNNILKNCTPQEEETSKICDLYPTINFSAEELIDDVTPPSILLQGLSMIDTIDTR